MILKKRLGQMNGEEEILQNNFSKKNVSRLGASNDSAVYSRV